MLKKNNFFGKLWTNFVETQPDMKKQQRFFTQFTSKIIFLCLSNLHDRQMMLFVEFDLFNLKVAHLLTLPSCHLMFLLLLFEIEIIFSKKTGSFL